MPKFSVTTKKEVLATIEVDVKFPLYFVYDGTWDSDNWEVYKQITRLLEDRTTVTITKSRSFTSYATYEIVEHVSKNLDEFNSYFTKDSSRTYTNDPSEFDELLAEIRAMVN